MSKQTYLVIQSCGSRHTVRDAASFMVEGGEAFFYENGVRVAYFSGVSAVVVQADPVQPSAIETLGPLAGSVSVESFERVGSPAFVGEAMLTGSVVINVHCNGAVPANVVAEAVASAVNTVHGVV